MKTNATTSFRLVAALVIVLFAGCAPAYHSYSGCSVNCQYCVPPPLPYTHYDARACHSCAVSKYLGSVHLPTDDAVDPVSEVNQGTTQE